MFDNTFEFSLISTSMNNEAIYGDNMLPNYKNIANRQKLIITLFGVIV